MTGEIGQGLMIFVTQRSQHAPGLQVDAVGFQVVAKASRDDTGRAIQQIADRMIEIVIGSSRRVRLCFSSR